MVNEITASLAPVRKSHSTSFNIELFAPGINYLGLTKDSLASIGV